MYAERLQPVSGHVFSREGKRGTVWYAKWRDVEGQHQKKLGPGWTAKGAPPVGYLRRREAQAELEAILVDSRRGALRRVKVGLLFRDVAAEWLRHGELGRGWKPTTIKDYRSVVNAHLLPAFGAKRVDAITSRSIERWRSDWLAETGRTRQAAKLVSVLHAIFERTRKTQGLTVNPVATVERYSVPYDRASYDFYSPEQVMALARAAASEQDGALYLVAAFTGLRRGELLALRWRDVDFERQSIRVERNYSHGQVVTPKSGHGRAVPMVPEVAQVLASINASTSPAATTSSSSVRPAATLTAQRCAVASRPRWNWPRSRHCASTTCATLSAHWRSTRPRSSRCRLGWATPTSTPRCATSTTRTVETRRRCSPERSPSTLPAALAYRFWHE